MKGDFSRIIFDSRNHYAGVLQQEGRVWLDSDWNESVQEQIALMQSGLKDMIGPSGMATASAFQISPATTPSAPYDFQIAAGRAYVNGLQCQLDAGTTYVNQPDLLDPVPVPLTSGASTAALVYLEVWQRLITFLEDDAIREPALGGPDTSARVKTVAQVKFVVLPSGTTGITADQAIQFLPTSGQGVLTTQISTRLTEDHLYRVQVHDPGDVFPSTGSGASITPLASDTLAGSITLALSAPLSSSQISGALRTGLVVVSDLTGASERVAISAISADGTTITLSRPLINSYTVGNAAQVSAGIARVKWSRNNAAFAVSVVNVQPDLVTLSLAILGRDSVTALRRGDVVEITDDASELGPGRGHLTTLASDPDPDLGAVVLTDPLPQSFKLNTTSPPSSLTSSRHLVLRRWDGATDTTGNTASDSDTVRSFGDGVQIFLGGSDLRASDYWQFTSRAASGSVQTLFNALPAGVTRFRTPLAVVVWIQSQATSPPGGFVMTVLKDCRKIFQPLSNAPQPDPGIHISGISVVDPASGAASPLLNDSNIPTTSFGGINVICDGPVSLPSPAICVVDVESPVTLSSQGTILPEGLPGTNIQGYFETPLTGTVASQGNVISWRANPQTQGYVNRLLAQVPGDRGILTRLRLNGNFIWSLTNTAAFLDGEAFASHARVANQPGTGLVQIAVFGTGLSAQGVLAADGLIDSHYKLVSSADPNSVATDAFVANSSAYPIPPWIRNGPNSKWIAPLPNAAANLNPGVYQYRTTFDLTGLDPTTAVLNGQWAADNLGLIQLNGVTVPNSASLGYRSFTIFSITSGFVQGINTLDFIVTNQPNSPFPPNPTGLRVDIGGFANQAPKSNVSLMLPSGDKRRGGDFEMWFWLVAGSVFIIAIQVTPGGSLQVRSAATVTLTLNAVVTNPPAVVAVIITNPAILQANLVTPISIFGTGVTPTGQLAIDGATESHYALINSADPSAPGPVVYVANSNSYPIPPWLSNGPNSKWIAPLPNAAANLNHGNYTYRTTFDLTGMDPSTVVLSGQFAADDFVNIQLNGVPVPNNGANVSTTGGFTSFTPFSITRGTSVTFNSGLNTLDFIVTNSPTSPTPTGLRVDISGIANLLPPNNISFKTPATTPPSLNVPVPAGSRTASFTVTGLALGQTDIQASLGGSTVSTTAVVIGATQDFVLQVTPPLQTVTAGGSVTFVVAITPISGFAGTVNLSVSGLPPQALALFSAATISGGTGSVILTINTFGATAAGSNTLTISAISNDGTVTHSAAVTLVVMQPQLAITLRPTAFLQDSDRGEIFIDFDRPFVEPLALGGDEGGIYIAPDIDVDIDDDIDVIRFLGRVPFKNPANAFDGDQSSFAWAQSISGCNWFGWSALGRTPAAITLKILSQVLPPGKDTLATSVAVTYSTDGGNTFTSIYQTTASRSLMTDVISLPVNTDLTKVQVRASYVGQFLAAKIQIHEIWIEVTG